MASKPRNHHSYPETENFCRRDKRWTQACRNQQAPQLPCPALADIRALLAQAHRNVDARLELGNLLLVLEQYVGARTPVVDNRYDMDGSLFNKGLRHTLSQDPLLKRKYKTLMRYKALAKGRTEK